MNSLLLPQEYSPLLPYRRGSYRKRKTKKKNSRSGNKIKNGPVVPVSSTPGSRLVFQTGAREGYFEDPLSHSLSLSSHRKRLPCFPSPSTCPPLPLPILCDSFKEASYVVLVVPLRFLSSDLSKLSF